MSIWWNWECDSGYPAIDLMCSADDRTKMIAEYDRDKVVDRFSGMTLGRVMELTKEQA